MDVNRRNTGVNERPDTPLATAAAAQDQVGGLRPGEPPPAGDVPPMAPPRRRRAAKPAATAYRLGPRIRLASHTPRYQRQPGDPVYRPLQIYTVDPSRPRRDGQTAEINVPYEKLRKGPAGFRFKVVKSGSWPLKDYGPVDLDDDKLLISNGRAPAPTDPVFHHQMVYAVAMNTYAVFRTALGREISWGFAGDKLKIVPHAFEQANATYVRGDKALSFGWYRVEADENVDMPAGSVIFSCLSHDVIAHELTHALLDGLRVRFDRASNPDVGAFHEAFADLVALLQRFSYAQVVRNIIVHADGDLRKPGDWQRLVFELARGQGQSALRVIDLEGSRRYDAASEAHDLGTILVSAVMDAFVTIYSRKAAPILRLATGGREAVLEGESIDADLIGQLTHIASRLASHFLSMCIRAIDYCPPVDITFGEYLRALITADRDLIPDDEWAYREALVDAFRKRRIFPQSVAALTEDALLWDAPPEPIGEPGLNFGELRFSGDPGTAADAREAARQAKLVGKLVSQPTNLPLFGLADRRDPELGRDKVDPPVVESVRSLRRVGPDGQLAFGLVAEVIQRRYVPGGGGYPAFTFRGGATIIFGSEGEVRFVISKNVKSKERLARQRDYSVVAGADVYALASCRHINDDRPAAADGPQ